MEATTAEPGGGMRAGGMEVWLLGPLRVSVAGRPVELPAGRLRPLLPGAPGCVVVVTSRDRLSGLVATSGAHPLALGLSPTR